MRCNVCQLWINCLPALNAPSNRYILCDHKWNSFKHFFFIISTLLTFPDRESWRDTRERRGSPEVSAGCGGRSVVWMWLWTHLVELYPGHTWSSECMTPRQSYNPRQGQNCLCRPGCYLSELLMVPLQVLSSFAVRTLPDEQPGGGPRPLTRHLWFDCQGSSCSLCCHVIQQLGTTSRCVTKPMNFSAIQWDELYLFSKDLNLFRVCPSLVHSLGPRVLHKFPYIA